MLGLGETSEKQLETSPVGELFAMLRLAGYLGQVSGAFQAGSVRGDEDPRHFGT